MSRNEKNMKHSAKREDEKLTDEARSMGAARSKRFPNFISKYRPADRLVTATKLPASVASNRPSVAGVAARVRVRLWGLRQPEALAVLP